MEKIAAFKYLTVLTLPLSVALSFSLHGLWTFLPLCYIFLFIPILEILVGANHGNMDQVEEELKKEDPIYDWLLYIIVPVQFGFLVAFLFSIQETGLTAMEMAGRITAMGIMCGNFGINVAHELGHRSTKHEQWMAKALLLTSLYMHFFIEHNRGHHRKVSTPEDPASARFGETVYGFWLRSVVLGYLSAWKLEGDRLAKKRQPFISIHNEMLQFQVIQALLLTAIGLYFGAWPLLAYLMASTMGFLLLETVNYIEHYGLQRRLKNAGHYERVLPAHSWNSDHLIGRLMLFELSRHSDHHFKASRKYQVLRHHPESPQMPTGYPGMMVLALFPPLWFTVMHRRIRRYQQLQVIPTA